MQDLRKVTIYVDNKECTAVVPLRLALFSAIAWQSERFPYCSVPVVTETTSQKTALKLLSICLFGSVSWT